MAGKRPGAGWSLGPADRQHEVSRVVRSVAPGEQRFSIELERRAKGKVVTLVVGAVLTEPELKQLGKKLKAACGTGGTAKAGAIELQGDCRDRVNAWLEQQGWGLR